MSRPPPRRARAWRLALALLSLLPLAPTLGACRRFSQQAADLEVRATLQERRRIVPEVVGHLDVDAADRVARARRKQERYTLTLEDALALAAASSREYLAQREDVYLTALDLTGVRNDYNPIFATQLGLGARADRDDVRPEGNLAGGYSQKFESGGSLVLDLATGFFASILSGDPFEAARSVLRASLELPMARGSGWVAREPLTQAERDVLYALRTYARFQQEFTVDVANEYYRLLEDRDTWKNEQRTYDSLRRLLERQEALGAGGAGRLPDFEVDQTRQDVLVAENRTLVARTRYESSLDAFLLTLGIPVDTEVELPDDDLETLRRRGPRAVPLSAADAVPTALQHRLDLRNVEDQREDALRRVLVAKNAMGLEANLLLDGLGRRNEGSDSNLEDADLEAFAGVTVDLPLERTQERNDLRTASIRALRARRAVEALQDGIEREVREALRQLERARQSYRIEEEGVRLAQRRVESTDLLLEAGEATTRDRLDAEAALVTARNALTRALVDHAIARLVLLRDVGVLEVGSDGAWIEPLSPAAAGAAAPDAASAVEVPAASAAPAAGDAQPERSVPDSP